MREPQKHGSGYYELFPMSGRVPLNQAILSIVLVGMICQPGTAQIRREISKAEEGVRQFLVEYIESEHGQVDGARYEVGFSDLNGDGIKEAIVYLSGREWCGTAGCQTLVLTRSRDSYRLAGRILATRPPIRVLYRKEHGWRTLGAWVRGTGVSAYEAAFPFDGKNYAISAAPGYASRLKSNGEGEIVIPVSANEQALSTDH
jgi:hypothetical protein